MHQLRVENLGKAYKHYRHRSLRLAEWLCFGRRIFHKAHWVLSDVNFAIDPGEAVGVIGQNGAGKSTLLKLITGTTVPTAGKIEVRGRVAALLELGMGFHPDFTGRQNVFMAGQLLGFNTAEITSRMPEIEGFAEIGAFIDEPVRTYSSGMQMRVAFSAATAIRPDILIVDEALAVGDAYFQHKCFARIREFKRAGTTLLFVSHDPAAVKTLCDRALLFESGRLTKDGAPDAVLDYYNAVIARREADYAIREAEQLMGRGTRSGNQKAVIKSVELLEGGVSVRSIHCSRPATIRVMVEIQRDIPELTTGILIRDRLGNDVFGTNSHHLGLKPSPRKAGKTYRYDFSIAAMTLGAGTYSIAAALHSADTHHANNYDWWDQSLVFHVIPGDGPPSIGVCRLQTECRIEEIGQQQLAAHA